MKSRNISFCRWTLLIGVVGLVFTCCYNRQSAGDHAEMRRQRLLEIYPVGKTTRKDVEARWKKTPQIQASRPATGWEAEADNWTKTYVMKAEARIGKKIARVERYYGPDGFLSLCYCWFYYDSSDRLLDAEWQWSSD